MLTTVVMCAHHDACIHTARIHYSRETLHFAHYICVGLKYSFSSDSFVVYLPAMVNRDFH